MSIEQKVKQLLGTMCLEEKVGQLFILAFAGKDLDYAKDLVKTKHVGGFYITDDNASSLTEATQLSEILQHQAALRGCDAPLLLAVDQEGAWGILTQHTDVGPGNLALGKADDVVLTEKMYQTFAQQMGSIGYNTLLSPCADINADPNNPIIGLRSFGEQTDKVAKHVAAAVRGAKKAGNLSCAKHFPGHGDTHIDSHQSLPIVNKSLAELRAQDLVPFQRAIEAGVDLIMTSHIQYPQVDAQYPATLSQAILTELLVNEMGFKGLIITDSMNMWAMRKNYQPEQAAVLALQAGAHFVMLSEEHYENSTTDYKALQAQTIQGVVNAVKQGELSEAIIDTRLAHVLTYKYQQLQNLPLQPQLSSNEIKAIVATACEKSLTVLRNSQGLWPLENQEYSLFFATEPRCYDDIVNCRGIGPNDPHSAKEVLISQLQQRKSTLNILDWHDFSELLNSDSVPDIVLPLVIVTEDYPLPGTRFDVQSQQDLVQKALSKWQEQVVVLAMRSDYELTQYTDLSTYICTYSSRSCAASALANKL